MNNFSKIEISRSKRVVDMFYRGDLSLNDTSLYMLVNIVIGYIFGYSTLIYSTAGTGWLGWLELACVVAITIVGFVGCRSIDENENDFFIYDFICLSVPIGFTTILSFWVLYWIVWFSFGGVVSNLNINDYSGSKFLFFIIEKGQIYSIFLINILINFVYFKRMRNALFKVRYIRERM